MKVELQVNAITVYNIAILNNIVVRVLSNIEL